MSTFPDHCKCGAALDNVHDAGKPYAWAVYECGTERALPGGVPFEDTKRMIERSPMCRFAIALAREAGITTARARHIWRDSQLKTVV